MPDTFDIKIYYEDTDCGGVVYYGKYLGFLERARTDYMQRRGIDIRSLMAEGTYFVVVSVDIKYRKSARYADIITIHTEIDELSFASITFAHKILLKDTPIATAKVKLATVGTQPNETELKPKKMTKEMADALKA